jgi:hypothetical protein
MAAYQAALGGDPVPVLRLPPPQIDLPKEPRNRSLRQYVYVIGVRNAGPVKIGVTSNLPGRLSSLQTGYPQKLVVLARLRGDEADEAKAHAMFEDERLEGEWFERSERVRQFIDMVQRREPIDRCRELLGANEWDGAS